MTTFSPNRSMPVRVNVQEHAGILLDSATNIESLPLGDVRPEVFLSLFVTETTTRKITLRFKDADTKTLVYGQATVKSPHDVVDFHKIPVPEHWVVQGLTVARGLAIAGDSGFMTQVALGFVMLKEDKSRFVESLYLHCPRAITLVYGDSVTTLGSDQVASVPSLTTMPGQGVVHLMDAHGIVREVLKTAFQQSYVYRDFKITSKSVGDAFAQIYASISPSPTVEAVPTPVFAQTSVAESLRVWHGIVQDILPAFQTKFQVNLGGTVSVGVVQPEMDGSDGYEIVSKYKDLCDLRKSESTSLTSWVFRLQVLHEDATSDTCLRLGLYKLLEVFLDTTSKCCFCSRADSKNSPYPLCSPFETKQTCCDACFAQVVVPQRVTMTAMRNKMPMTPNSAMDDDEDMIPEDSDGKSPSVSQGAMHFQRFLDDASRGDDHPYDHADEEDDIVTGFISPPKLRKPAKLKRTRRPKDSPVEDLKWRMQRNKFAKVQGQGGIRRGEAYDAMIDERIEEEKLEAISMGVSERIFDALVVEWRAAWRTRDE